MTRDKRTDESAPHPIDVHVGARVRMRRKFLSMTQDELAKSLDLTFQQVQKYERGANRISASKLYDISRALSVHVGYFFEGLADEATASDFKEISSERVAHAFLITAEGIELAQAFPQIKSAKLRRKVAELVRTLAGDADE